VETDGGFMLDKKPERRSIRAWGLRAFGFSVSAFCAILVAAIPIDDGFNPISFALSDSEYGINSEQRFVITENRKNAERFVQALQSGNYDLGENDLPYLSAYWQSSIEPVSRPLSTKLVSSGDSNEPAKNVINADLDNLTSQELPQQINEERNSKPPKPHKMDEYNFDPELLSPVCRPDFDYCLSTCDRNDNGQLDTELSAEVQCVSYCTRQAIRCEVQVCEDKRDSLQRSITKWGFFVLLGGIALLFLIPPLGAVLFVAGFVVMMFSISPIMTWILAFQCA